MAFHDVNNSTNLGISRKCLSRKTVNCLTKAGILLDKAAIIEALKKGILCPFRWPPNYGSKTHAELCKWVGLDVKTLAFSKPEIDIAPFPENGLSYRANRCLSRAGIPATKKSVRHALQTGMLYPGKHPGSYGQTTHAEICRWAGVLRLKKTVDAIPSSSLTGHK